MAITARQVGLATILLLLAPLQIVLQAQEALTIGWAELDTTKLDEGMSRLGVLIPKALIGVTSFITDRYVPQSEASLSSTRILSADLEKAKDAIATARRKRDLISLTGLDPFKRAADLRTAQSTLDKALADLEQLFLRQTSIQDDAESRTAELKPWSGHGDGKLLPPVVIPALACSENKLDILIYGKAESVGSFMLVELSLYNATTDEETWKAVEYTAFDDLDGVVSSLERPLATAIAARPFGRVIFNVNQEDVKILVDGFEISGSQLTFFSQGSHLATATATGHQRVSSRFAVVPGKDTFVELSLKKLQIAPIFIDSNPPGAALFLDGVPQGVTPLELPGADSTRVLNARLNGFEDRSLILRPGFDSDRVIMNLQAADGLSYTDRFEEAKSSFYQSLGWFILSLPVTILSYGTLNTYINLRPLPSTVPERTENSLTVYYYSSQTIFWISAVLSVSLATNSIVRLVSYIKTAR